MEFIDGYALRIESKRSFDVAIATITILLKDEGFGILTEIDVRETLKAKLDVDFKPFRILGACNPPFAHRALQAEPLVSLLLPCNVVVWDEGDHRVVAAMEPKLLAQMVGQPRVVAVAAEVSERIHRVLDRYETMESDA